MIVQTYPPILLPFPPHFYLILFNNSDLTNLELLFPWPQSTGPVAKGRRPTLSLEALLCHYGAYSEGWAKWGEVAGFGHGKHSGY